MFLTIAALAAFLTSTTGVLSLSCRVGMNMSVGGIPAGNYWNQMQCKGKTCMIEELSIGLTDAQFTHAKLTFGGCFSQDVQDRLSCSTQNDRKGIYINAKELLEIASTLDDLTVMILADMFRDPNRFASYGGLLAQMYEGFQNFLESAGFQRGKVQELLNSVMYHDLTDDEFIKLISDLGTTNQATERLSSAMLDFTIRQSGVDILPEKVTSITRAVTALIFPILENAKFDAEGMFSKMANAFESQHSDLLDEDCLFLFPTLFVTEIVMASNTNQVPDRIYDLLFVPIHHITERCSSLYPYDQHIHYNHFLQKRLLSVLKDHAKCTDGFFPCRTKLRNAMTAISMKYLESLQTTSTPSPSALYLASQRWTTKMGPIMNKAMSNPIAVLGSIFKTYATEGRQETLEYLHALSASLKALIKEYGLYTFCEDYYCTRHMCNSQTALREKSQLEPLRHWIRVLKTPGGGPCATRVRRSHGDTLGPYGGYKHEHHKQVVYRSSNVEEINRGYTLHAL